MTDSIPAKVEKLLSELTGRGFDLRLPIDLDSIVELHGITVLDDYSLEQRNSIGEIMFEGNDPVIRINPQQNRYESRRRFTLAHELGHYFLHADEAKRGFTDNVKTMSRTNSYWDPKEYEANSFAAHLLMPTRMVFEEGGRFIRQSLEGCPDTKVSMASLVEHLAGVFNVSSKAMEYHLKNLMTASQPNPSNIPNN